MKTYFAFLCISAILTTAFASQASVASSARAIAEIKYNKAHSLGNDHIFDPRDGWQSVNVTNLQYKYRRSSAIQKHDESSFSKRADKSPLGAAVSIVSDTLRKVFKGLKGQGKPEDAIITWYTGHDLLNPSCWTNGRWAPTDESFACALTMEGWNDRPQCFKFLELCNTPKRCIFVRVVDTCAGCAPGTKHIDLTKAAFGQLATLDIGRLLVKYRPAVTEPDNWSEKLWGPQVHDASTHKNRTKN